MSIDSTNYKYFDLKKLSEKFNFELNKIPNSIKIILENLIRNEDSTSIKKEMIKNLCSKINQSKEVKKNSVTIRKLGTDKQEILKVSQAIQKISKQNKSPTI